MFRAASWHYKHIWTCPRTLRFRARLTTRQTFSAPLPRRFLVHLLTDAIICCLTQLRYVIAICPVMSHICSRKRRRSKNKKIKKQIDLLKLLIKKRRRASSCLFFWCHITDTFIQIQMHSGSIHHTPTDLILFLCAEQQETAEINEQPQSSSGCSLLCFLQVCVITTNSLHFWLSRSCSDGPELVFFFFYYTFRTTSRAPFICTSTSEIQHSYHPYLFR